MYVHTLERKGEGSKLKKKCKQHEQTHVCTKRDENMPSFVALCVELSVQRQIKRKHSIKHLKYTGISECEKHNAVICDKYYVLLCSISCALFHTRVFNYRNNLIFIQNPPIDC